jgi:hypothetical protein
MSKSKVGILLAGAVGAAFLTVGGCASQGSGAATPANLPNNCASVEQNACKGKASCVSHTSKKHHHKKTTVSTTTTATQTSTEETKK